MSKFVEALDTYMQRRDRRNKMTARATVISVTHSLAMVVINGSSKMQPARIPDNLTIEAGDQCTLEPNQNNQDIRWLVSTVIRRSAYGAANGSNQSFVSLYPPPNFRVIEAVGGAVTFAWDAPAELPVVFEIETASSSEATEGTKVLQTRGSYAIIPTASDIYARIRSISATGASSSWTDWLLGSPAVSTRSANLIQVSFTYASPTTVGIVSASLGSFVTKVVVEVTTAFNTAATLKIGEPGTTDRLMLTTENDLGLVGVYETQPLYEYPDAASINATFAYASATQGAGKITLIF